MPDFLALLRGINVGGKNKVPMPELKESFEQVGFLNVRTYINSGNVIFLSKETNAETLQTICQDAIKQTFGLTIAVCVISAEDLKAAVTNAPDWFDQDPNSKHNVIFVIAPQTAGKVLESVGEAKPEYEKVGCFGRVIFWSAPLDTFSHTRWSKVVGTAAYKDITIRNANTAKKLLKLFEEEQK